MNQGVYSSMDPWIQLPICTQVYQLISKGLVQNQKTENRNGIFLIMLLKCFSDGFFKEFSQKFSMVTLREAKRGSAGVPVAKCEAAGDTQSVQEMTM